MTPEPTQAPVRVITEFPATLTTGEPFRFTWEGATYWAAAQWPHVFHEGVALADHLGKTARGFYDGLRLISQP